jgi:hypothetical protein
VLEGLNDIQMRDILMLLIFSKARIIGKFSALVKMDKFTALVKSGKIDQFSALVKSDKFAGLVKSDKTDKPDQTSFQP